jgi:two-component sensor histidine kinase
MSGRGREAAANEREASVDAGSACARLRLACDPSVVAEAARLLVTELVTNSLLHGIAEGEGWIDVLIERRARCLRIEVADPSSTGRRPVLRTVDQSSTSGWGLQLVDRLASDWGVETGSGTCVWCELATG